MPTSAQSHFQKRHKELPFGCWRPWSGNLSQKSLYLPLFISLYPNKLKSKTCHFCYRMYKSFYIFKVFELLSSSTVWRVMVECVGANLRQNYGAIWGWSQGKLSFFLINFRTLYKKHRKHSSITKGFNSITVDVRKTPVFQWCNKCKFS